MSRFELERHNRVEIIGAEPDNARVSTTAGVDQAIARQNQVALVIEARFLTMSALQSHLATQSDH